MTEGEQNRVLLEVANQLAKLLTTQVNFEIILRDFLVDILRGRAKIKNSGCLSSLRFPTPRAKARFSASSFCALTSRTAGHLLRLLAKPKFLIEPSSIGWSAIGFRAGRARALAADRPRS
jgi:hypothetical protein